jgi:hypothetical protein
LSFYLFYFQAEDGLGPVLDAPEPGVGPFVDAQPGVGPVVDAQPGVGPVVDAPQPGGGPALDAPQPIAVSCQYHLNG